MRELEVWFVMSASGLYCPSFVLESGLTSSSFDGSACVLEFSFQHGRVVQYLPEASRLEILREVLSNAKSLLQSLLLLARSHSFIILISKAAAMCIL